MSIELRTGRGGKLRPTWYGRYDVRGKRYTINLGVKIAGNPPPSLSLRDEGDIAFERSRALAQAKLAQIIDEARRKNDSAHLVERLYEMKTGEQLQSVLLTELPEEWTRIPRRRTPNERYAGQCRSTLKRFTAFLHEHYPQAEELGHVTRQVARAFMETEAKRGVTAKTWNDTLKLLRATCKYLLPAGSINPFSDIPTHETETIFRKPFTPEELKAILDVAQDDKFIRPILVAGICTAMRRGDCCLLQWKDVDLKKRFITVKTAKTGATVSIPIFPMLYDVLMARRVTEGFVFPEQAKMYQENPEGITYRVKQILFAALREPVSEAPSKLPEVDASEVRARGLSYLASLSDTPKTARMKQVFELYMDGKTVGQVAEAADMSKGTVSGHLNQIEQALKCRIVRGRHGEPGLTAEIRADTSLLRVTRHDSSRRASVRDFHSFRVTWVTLALTAGVPLELVQKVTGHKTAEIVLKHYFQPGREEFRRTLQMAMPKLLSNGQTTSEKLPKEEALEILDQTTAKTWIKDAARLRELIAVL
jgi:integrase